MDGIVPPHTAIIFCAAGILALLFTPKPPADDLNAVQEGAIDCMLVIVLLIVILQTYEYFFDKRKRGPVGLVFPRRRVA